MRLVLEPPVLVCALTKSYGVGEAILKLAKKRRVRLIANMALYLEYEAACHAVRYPQETHGKSLVVPAFLDLVADLVKPIGPPPSDWLPFMHDPIRDYVLMTAVVGRADAIVTFSVSDYARRKRYLEIPIWSPETVLSGIAAR